MNGMLSHPVCTTCKFYRELSGDDHRGFAYLHQVCTQLEIDIDKPDAFYCAYFEPRAIPDDSFDERGLA